MNIEVENDIEITVVSTDDSEVTLTEDIIGTFFHDTSSEEEIDDE